MAPSGGSTSLGTHAHEPEDLLAITEDDILTWTPHRLRRQCFQFGLVGDAPEGDLSTLREVFLEHWRTAVAASQAAAPQGTPQATDGVDSASGSLPRSPGGRFVTPPTSPRRPSGPSEPSVPFQNGAAARPDRDANPVPWALEHEDPEDFAAVDACDSLEEGMWLTPGRDPYAFAKGESPDANTVGPGEDLG